jgi:hypothetical protein
MQKSQMDQSTINTYLFSWNQEKWPWPEISKDSDQVKKGGKFQEEWTCVSHKKVKPGDRAFVSRVGSEPRGIFASGSIASAPFLSTSRHGKEIYKVRLEFDVLLDPGNDAILTLDLLTIGKLAGQLWTPQSSGISIKPAYAKELEMLWEDFLLKETYRNL